MSENEQNIPQYKWTPDDEELLQQLLEQKKDASFVRFTHIGRPPILNNEREERFLSALRRHGYIDVACKFAGFTNRVFYYWMEKAANLICDVDEIWCNVERAKDNNQVYTLSPREKSLLKSLKEPRTEQLIKFFQRVDYTIAELETVLATRILIASKTNWTAAAWMLERRAPQRWGRIDRDPSQLDSESKESGFSYIEVPTQEQKQLPEANVVRNLDGSIRKPMGNKLGQKRVPSLFKDRFRQQQALKNEK